VCERQFTGNAIDRGIASEQRRRIEHLLRARIALRGICRPVGVRLTWLLRPRSWDRPLCVGNVSKNE
jgi:hypothetical protein